MSSNLKSVNWSKGYKTEWKFPKKNSIAEKRLNPSGNQELFTSKDKGKGMCRISKRKLNWRKDISESSMKASMILPIPTDSSNIGQIHPFTAKKIPKTLTRSAQKKVLPTFQFKMN